MSANRNSSNSRNSRNSRNNGGRNRESHVSCTICSERYAATDNIYGGSCGHVFHWQCLQRWWEESKSCPICRCEDKVFFRLYLNFDEQDSSNEIPTTSQSANSVTITNDLTKEFQDLLYESDLYREEIKYLNRRIACLSIVNLHIDHSASESD